VPQKGSNASGNPAAVCVVLAIIIQGGKPSAETDASDWLALRPIAGQTRSLLRDGEARQYLCLPGPLPRSFHKLCD